MNEEIPNPYTFVLPSVVKCKARPSQVNAQRMIRLNYIPNAVNGQDNVQVALHVPGLPDFVVHEGQLNTTRIYLKLFGEISNGFAYSVNETVFLLSPGNLDSWIEEQFAEFGVIETWDAHWCCPCWFEFPSLWNGIFDLDASHIEVPYINGFGRIRLRHAHHGRLINLTDILLEKT